MSIQQIPEDYICAITGEIMKRPVIVCTQDHVFEEQAIQQWRLTNNTCPQCRTPLVPHFILARRLMNEIENYNMKIQPQQVQEQQVFQDAAVRCHPSIIELNNKKHLCITVEADANNIRQPTNYILGIDHSGSMSNLVDPKSNESLFTRMDLVYHTVNTAIEMMTEKDTLTLVGFSSDTKTICKALPMTTDGKTKVKRVLTALQPDGGTNIFEAVRVIASIANSDEMKDKNIVAALLTDGEETVGKPPRGTVETLRSMLSRKEMNKNPWCFSTFGFGYDINSQLLYQLSNLGKGSFGFIPDVTMVGTVFINYIATSAVTATRNATIQYTVDGVNYESIETGPLFVGHSRDYSVPLLASCPIEQIRVCVNSSEQQPVVQAASEFNKALHLFKEEIKAQKQNHNALEYVVQTFKDTTCEKTKQLLRDIESDDATEGQLGLATKFWNRWGIHYTLSYLRTVLERQQRLNFKDPGSLVMGNSPLLDEILGDGEKLFITLEPPKPSGYKAGLTQQQVQSIQSNTAQYIYQASQAAYNGGCFAKDMRVRMADGSRKVIQDIRPGDIVWTMLGPAEVKHFLTVGSKYPYQMMSKVPGKNMETCILTPFHPYMETKTGSWVQPHKTVGDESMYMETVYNLVLTYGHIIEVEGVFCCTLAHGIKGDVIEHPFFGTEKVIEAMSRQPGFEVGCPVYKNLQVRRDPNTNLIVDWFDDI